MQNYITNEHIREGRRDQIIKCFPQNDIITIMSEFMDVTNTTMYQREQNKTCATVTPHTALIMIDTFIRTCQ